MLHIDIVTIFPKMFAPVVGSSILKRAQTRKRLRITVHDLRKYTHDKRRTVDDRPYGGGPGMVMKPEPMYEAVEAIEAKRHRSAADRAGCCIVLMAPTGEPLTQRIATELSSRTHLVILCGHYEGVDERIRLGLVDQELSIGDYILTGGELPAMVVIDAVARLVPGVLGHEQATQEESFSQGLLEYPHYTRPVKFRDMEVPKVLRSGDHRRIATWRKLHAFARTAGARPDLLAATRKMESHHLSFGCRKQPNS